MGSPISPFTKAAVLISSQKVPIKDLSLAKHSLELFNLTDPRFKLYSAGNIKLNSDARAIDRECAKDIKKRLRSRPNNKKRKHEQNRKQYRSDAKILQKPWQAWQYKKTKNKIWKDLYCPPKWLPTEEYRHKPGPITISINGINSPCPLLKLPRLNAICWYAESDQIKKIQWTGGESDLEKFQNGRLFKRRLEAERMKNLLIYISMVG